MNQLDRGEPPKTYKEVKGHSTVSTVFIGIIFAAAAVTWLFHWQMGLLLAVLGGLVFGLTFRGNHRIEVDDPKDQQ